MKQTMDHLRERQQAPQSEPSMHQTPLHILATPDINSGNLLTLPGGHLPIGVRGGSVSIINNAAHILRANGIEFTPKAHRFIQDEDTRQHGYAYVVESPWHFDLPEHIDLTNERRYEMTPATPHPATKPLIELHPWTSLLARIQSANYRREQLNTTREETDKLPLREAEEAFVRAFGAYILSRGIK